MTLRQLTLSYFVSRFCDIPCKITVCTVLDLISPFAVIKLFRLCCTPLEINKNISAPYQSDANLRPLVYTVDPSQGSRRRINYWTDLNLVLRIGIRMFLGLLDPDHRIH